MPERLESEVLQKARYINTLTFTFFYLLYYTGPPIRRGVSSDDQTRV